jgi:hypothetical protein
MGETITRSPLAWPIGWKRTAPQARAVAKFAKADLRWLADGAGYRSPRPITVAESITRIMQQLDRMGVRTVDVIVSTNLDVRLDGLPRSGQPKPEDPGAAVYWPTPQGMRCMAIDRYTTVADNLAAIAATLEAMRAIERHGGAEVLDRAFTGFAALPAPDARRTWRQILGFGPTEKVGAQLATARFRSLAQQAHPDRGGSHDRMAELNAAIEEAQRELRA